MKRWCRYCKLFTLPAPAHPGRPRVCHICQRPYDPGAPLETAATAADRQAPRPAAAEAGGHHREGAGR